MRRLIGAVLVVLAPAQPAAPPLALLKTIELPNVEGRIDHLAYDPDRAHLFLAALGHNSVEVVDTERGTHLKHLAGYQEPQGIAFVPDTRAVVVANGQGAGAQIIDAIDFHSLRTIASATTRTTCGTTRRRSACMSATAAERSPQSTPRPAALPEGSR